MNMFVVKIDLCVGSEMKPEIHQNIMSEVYMFVCFMCETLMSAVVLCAAFLNNFLHCIFYPTALKRAVRVLFSPMVSGWAGSGKKFIRAVSQKL